MKNSRADVLEELINLLLVNWSDGKKEVVNGMDFYTTAKYLGNMTPKADKRYIKSVEILKGPEAKVLYGSNKSNTK